MRKIRMGMVGGGEGAFIGAVHRMAAALDGQIELVCGAFSSSAEKSLRSGAALYLPADRCYRDYQQMFQRERELPADERMDFVSIVTPNHMHLPVAEMALEMGFPVMSDKPATLNLAECRSLVNAVRATGLRYGLTHTYTGYPMVKEARERIAAGELGAIRKVVVEYPQGWLADKNASGKQAEWRLDQSRSGTSCCMGDIGVHAANLAEYILGCEISALSASLMALPGRALDDDGLVQLRFASGARGVLIASQISQGEENNLRIRVYGEDAALEWSHTEPNSLLLKSNVQPSQILRAGGPGLSELALANLRTPAGHPEGYIEAFANHYRNFAHCLQADLTCIAAPSLAVDVPGIEDAWRGMRFIDAAVRSSAADGCWLELEELPQGEQ